MNHPLCSTPSSPRSFVSSSARLVLGLLTGSVLVAALFSGCGSTDDGTAASTCGAGKKNQGGVCVPDSTGGSGGTAGSGGGSGGASAGTGGFLPSGDEACPADPSTILGQCPGANACGEVEASQAANCDAALPCGSGRIQFVEIKYEEIQALAQNGKDAVVRGNQNKLPPDGCKTDSPCNVEPEMGFTWVYVRVDGIKAHFQNVPNKDLVVEVDEPWRLYADSEFASTVDCWAIGKLCLQMPLQASADGVSWADFEGVSHDTPALVRNLRIHLVEKGENGCPEP